MSFLDKILVKSKTSKSKKHAVPKRRRLGFEGLENRELLSVSATEFASIRSRYADLELSTNINDYNIIEISADQLSETKLREAIIEAGETTKDDLIVIRTTTTQNTMTLTGGALEIDIDPEEFGYTTIVSFGSDNLTIDANGNSRIFNIWGSSVDLGGITITGGKELFYGIGGGGIYASYSYVAISNCLFSENTADRGGGIYAFDCAVGIYNSTFVRNTAVDTAGGAVAVFESDLTIDKTTFEQNRVSTGFYADGGAVYAENTFSTVTNTFFLGNSADGEWGSWGGGFFQKWGTSDLTNVVFSGNYCAGNESLGGGMLQRGGTATLTNVTVAGNQASKYGAGYYVDGHDDGGPAVANINNSIFSLNYGENYHTSKGGTTHRNNCYIDGNPRFVRGPGAIGSGDYGNLNLTSSSPAINAGNNALIPQGITKDIVGNARIINGKVDIGAYEYGSAPVVPASPATASAVSASGSVTKISWSKVDGATSYDIMGYNAKDKYWWKIANTASTSYNAQAYSANVTIVAVHAVNSAGRSTGKTASIFRAPTTVSAVAASGNQTKISWNAVAGATSYEIMGYNKAGNYWWKIGTTNKTSYNAPGYTANVTTIAVHAIRASDRTGGVATSIFRAPSGVSVVAASATQTKITWNAVSGATSYDIMGYNKAGNYWWKIGTTNKTSYDAPAYSTNVTTIAVHAIRASDRTVGTTAPVVRAPSNVTASSLSSTSIRFSWNAVTGATRYELAIYNSVTKKWSTLTSVTQNTYTATGLPVGVTQVSVHAVNAAGRTAGATATVR